MMYKELKPQGLLFRNTVIGPLSSTVYIINKCADMLPDSDLFYDVSLL